MEEFPEPLYIGFRRLYDEAEVEAWQRKRLEERGTTPPPKRERKTKEYSTANGPSEKEDGTPGEGNC